MSIASKVAGKLSKSGLAKLKKLMQNAKDKKATKAVPKKADKRIEGAGAQSARPKGSIGKTRTQDSPRGSVAGMSMSAAKKQQMRNTANLKGKVGLARKYDDIMLGIRRRVQAAVKAGDNEKAKNLLSGTGISVTDFKAIVKQRGKV